LPTILILFLPLKLISDYPKVKMNISTDINILGGLPDFNLIKVFMRGSVYSLNEGGGHHSYTAIKTEKSVKRFEHAIRRFFLTFKNKDSGQLITSVLTAESISSNSLLLLFWNASVNDDLMNYLNEKVYLPDFYSGRITIKRNEVIACIKELRESEKSLQSWADSTITKTSSEYLTLLKKFGLMEGSQTKTIVHPYLNDIMLILFVYWLIAVETKANLLESSWLGYCFSEKQVFIERIMQRKFAKFINVNYTGDKLKIEPTFSYLEIYDALTQS
jgi:hypothetical protein